MDYLLPLLLGVPAVGAVVAAAVPVRTAKVWALLVSLLTAAVSVWLVAAAPWWSSAAAQQTIDQTLLVKFIPAAHGLAGLQNLGVNFSLGMDSISLWLVVLTACLTPLAILSSWGSIKDREKEYYAWMLVLLVAMLGVFVARDLLLFYIFFELTLVPMFFIIGIWGGPERRYAAGKFFLFTFTGSVFTLAGAIYLGLHAGPNGSPSFALSDVIRHAQTDLTAGQRYWIFLAFLAGFAVKVPLFPVHTWLPLAHTEAPTAGSVILAGVLLKLGTYGLLRLAIPVGLPDVTLGLVQVLGVLCVIGIIYGALVAWVQPDIKKLVAYSSVSHLGFCVLGLVALNAVGIQGSVLYMINHGLSTGALFLVIGMIYDRYHTRDINQLSGLARRMPKLAFFFVLFALSSIGLPGLNGFVSEFLTVLGAFTSGHLGIVYGTLAALGVILGAVYMLHMVAKVIWGPLKTPHVQGHGHDEAPGDIGGREIAILVPIALAVLFLGVAPNSVLTTLRGPVDLLTRPAGPTARAGWLVEAKRTGNETRMTKPEIRMNDEAPMTNGLAVRE